MSGVGGHAPPDRRVTPGPHPQPLPRWRGRGEFRSAGILPAPPPWYRADHRTRTRRAVDRRTDRRGGHRFRSPLPRSGGGAGGGGPWAMPPPSRRKQIASQPRSRSGQDARAPTTAPRRARRFRRGGLPSHSFAGRTPALPVPAPAGSGGCWRPGHAREACAGTAGEVREDGVGDRDGGGEHPPDGDDVGRQEEAPDPCGVAAPGRLQVPAPRLPRQEVTLDPPAGCTGVQGVVPGAPDGARAHRPEVLADGPATIGRPPLTRQGRRGTLR